MKCLKMVVYSSLFAALSPSYAAEQTLAVSLNGGNIEVSVPANAYDDTSKLYVVWGVADHGAEISAWPLANRRACDGSLSASAATYQISADGIPAGSVVRAIVTSDVRLIDGYVSLGNEQYVNTGIKGNEAYGVDFKFRCTGGENWHSVIGSKCDNFTIGKRYTNKEFYLRYRTKDLGRDLFNFDDDTIPHRFRIVNRECWLDDLQIKTGLEGGSIGTDDKNILVGSSSLEDGTSGRYCYGEWHYVRIFNANGGYMLHLVAAVRGNTSSPEVVFYDKVTGKVFANAGMGTLGCDTSAAVTETIPLTTACSAALSMAKTARWTGAGDRGNVNDPANWSCTDAAGETVVSAPDAQTLVKIEGSTTFNIPAGQTLLCSSLELNDVQLAADCDWSGIDAVNAFAPVYALQYLDAPKDAYVDTGFVPNGDTRVVFDVTVRGTLESWFGVSGDDSNYWWRKSVFAVSNDGGGIYSGFGDSGGTFAPVAANGRHTIDFYKGELKVDGVKHTTHSAQTLSL